jgi:hypothetical protein
MTMQIILLLTDPADLPASRAADTLIGMFPEEITPRKLVLDNLLPCRQCGRCEKTGHCILEDDLSRNLSVLQAADGLLLTASFLYGAPPHSLQDAVQRLVTSSPACLRQKPIALLGCLRRGEAEASFAPLLKELMHSGCLLITGSYGSFLTENDPHQYEILQELADEMTWVLQSLHASGLAAPAWKGPLPRPWRIR